MTTAYIGIDLHRTVIQICVLDQRGERIAEETDSLREPRGGLRCRRIRAPLRAGLSGRGGGARAQPLVRKRLSGSGSRRPGLRPAQARPQEAGQED